jgi:hypothetical protein
MKTTLACICLLMACAVLGYLAVGWGRTIWEQGFAAAISDQTTQPSLVATVGGGALGFMLVGVGCSLLRQRSHEER